jgi:hypothetical protein
MKNMGDSNSNSNDYTHPDNPLRPYSQDSRSHTSCTHPSSISSIMSSMSFQAFTSFIPLSWSSSQRPLSAAPPTSSLSHSTSSSISEATVVPNAVSSRKHGYVLRKKQLQLLKAQMETEGVGNMRTPVQCKKCVGDLVFI